MATMGTTTVPNMQVSCGLSHTVVCTDDGKVWTFGAGRQGQLGTHELHDNQDVPVLVSDAKNNTQEDDEDQIGSKPVIEVAAGSYHTVALRKDGSVYSWGSNANGRLGHGTSAEEMNNRNNKPRHPDAPMLIYSLQPHHIIQVSCGADFTLCVDNAGGVHSWGMGNYGNLGHGDTRDYSRPKLVHRLKSEVIRMVSGGAKHSLAVSQSGEIWAFGHGDNGRLGNNATRGSLVPERALGGIVTALAVFVSAGEAHSACLDDAGKLYTWGTGSYGRLGSGQETDQLVPVIVETLAKVKMMTVSCGAFHTCTVSLEGEMYVFGGGLYGKLGNESEENCILPGKLLGDDQVSGNSYTQVACGTFHTVAVNEEGTCLSWGFGGHGRLGIGSAEQRRKPVPVHGGFLKSLITGSSSQRFVRSIMNISDSLMKQKRKGGSGGGAGGAGGAPGGADKFLDDESPTKIVSVAAGAKHSMYMTVEGHVYSWGSDENGQCGQERDAGQGPHIPEQVKAHIGGLRVVGIACGAQHSLCVTARGDVYTWGQGSSGQLGHGSQSSINRPALVQLLSAHLIVAVDGGEDNSAAITDAGELYTWGAGEMGKLGQGQATTSALLPARVRGELSDKAVKTVSLGLGHTAVIVDQGTLYTWGAGWYGRLGHNDQTNVYMPKRIASMVFKQFETVSCGSYHTLAVSKDNQCYAWGRGDERLGSSQTNNQLVPKTVIGLTSRHIAVVSAIAGEEHSIVIAVDGSVYGWGRGKYGKLGISDFETPDKEKNEINPQSVLLYEREGDEPVRLNLGGHAKQRLGGELQSEDRRRVVSLSNHCVALNNNGDVYTWGNAGQGRLGVDFSELVPFAVPLGMRAHDALSGKNTAGVAEDSGRGRGKKSKRDGGESKMSERRKTRGGVGNSGGSGSGGGARGDVGSGGGGGADGLLGGGGEINTGVQYSGSEVDIAIEKFRRDRINPSAAFVYQALKSEPVANRIENVNMMSKTTASIRVQIEDEMSDLLELEREIESLETEIEIMLKSSISTKMPRGLAPGQLHGNTAKITADIVLQHNIFTKILEILLANPNYIRLMHKYYTSNASEVKLLWERDATALKPTFRRRFAEMIISIYGNMQRPHNEHLFLVCTRSIMLEELVSSSYTGDMSQVAANFVGGDSVFGELARSYFSLDTNFNDVENRYNELMKEMVAKSDSNEFNFEYDPVQVYYEIRKAQGKASAADKSILSFNDAQREGLYNSLPNVKNTVTNRVSQLCEVTGHWIDATKQSVKGISSGVRWVCRELLHELEKTHGRGKGAEFVVSSFLFDMYFRPVLINPKMIGRRADGRRRRMPKRLVKNLNEVAIMIKRSLTFAKHNSRIRWMVEANGVIERNQTSSLQWIREVADVEMDLPQKMVVDVYKEYLRFGPSVHTLRLPDVHLLRWMLLRYEKVQVKPDDPMQPYVVGPFGLFPPGDEVAIQLAENFARVPETVLGLGINFELNTRFYERMQRDKIKIDPFTEVPLPDYLAMDDCIKIQDVLIESTLDTKKKAFQDWLSSMSGTSDFRIPTTENGQSDIAMVRDEIAKNKEEKQKQKRYEDMEMLDNADKLLQQLLQEHTPITMVMGEILEQIAFRAKIAKKQKRELNSFYGLRVSVSAYRASLEQRRTNRMTYKDSLLWARGQEPGNGTVAKSAAIKANETLHGGNIVGSAHAKPADLKKRLARSRDVRGCHAEYSLKSLLVKSVITDFTIDPTANVSATELAHIETNLKFMISSIEPGNFKFIVVYDGDTVLDSFSVLTKDLLVMQRSMQTLFTPRVEEGGRTTSDPDLAKTTFQVSALLRILENLSMHRTMLGS